MLCLAFFLKRFTSFLFSISWNHLWMIHFIFFSQFSFLTKIWHDKNIAEHAYILAFLTIYLNSNISKTELCLTFLVRGVVLEHQPAILSFLMINWGLWYFFNDLTHNHFTIFWVLLFAKALAIKNFEYRQPS